MAEGRGRGQKLVVQEDFVVADGTRSAIIHGGETEMEEGEDQGVQEEHISFEIAMETLKRDSDEGTHFHAYSMRTFCSCRMTENEYLGQRNGILDQSSVMLSKYGCRIHMNCKQSRS
ncbi:uncharacterized protein LOC120269238 isoform X2 [Dioscorea cayenensis subsp. rotundata]|uniref:Uncharacterized protein LOC120269238 isoform X2 n=1 Tax=Dioscorea cayennensis subsp. rotundata TaxID=55577 RepID=A0AB40BYJ3_DIOCR|nr:uncharacterized protein LOC120269238 isoform X2 [Dioscorea cayenensis subsp. rotundata]